MILRLRALRINDYRGSTHAESYTWASFLRTSSASVWAEAQVGHSEHEPDEQPPHFSLYPHVPFLRNVRMERHARATTIARTTAVAKFMVSMEPPRFDCACFAACATFCSTRMASAGLSKPGRAKCPCDVSAAQENRCRLPARRKRMRRGGPPSERAPIVNLYAASAAPATTPGFSLSYLGMGRNSWNRMAASTAKANTVPMPNPPPASSVPNW